jgi:hypothetical protein
MGAVSSLVARLLVLSAVLAGAARGHDFWIEPSSYTPPRGGAVSLRLRVGEHFLGDAVPRDPALLLRFEVIAADGRRRPVLGAPGADPAGLLRLAPADGRLTVVYESAATPVDLSAEKLAAYLREEGLAALAAERAQRGQRGGARDSFSRHVKALLRVAGDAAPNAAESDAARPLGLALELVPERDPFAMAGGGILPLRLLFAGKPLAGTQVTAIPRLRPRQTVRARSDAHGRVALALGSGEWLVKAVQIETVAATGVASYRSWWTALTFRVPEVPRVQATNATAASR